MAGPRRRGVLLRFGGLGFRRGICSSRLARLLLPILLRPQTRGRPIDLSPDLDARLLLRLICTFLLRLADGTAFSRRLVQPCQRWARRRMVVLIPLMTRPIRLCILLILRQVGRVWCGDIGLADIFLAVGLGERGIGQAGPRFQERGSPRPARGVEARHRGPAWRCTVRGRFRCGGGASRGCGGLGILG